MASLPCNYVYPALFLREESTSFAKRASLLATELLRKARQFSGFLLVRYRTLTDESEQAYNEEINKGEAHYDGDDHSILALSTLAISGVASHD